MSNFKERIASLKLNVKQHQDQIKILLKEIKELEHFKTISNDNSTVDNSNVDNLLIIQIIQIKYYLKMKI